ncbi:MAG: serine/threonine protein kinase [Deltaproteobacteria bacterium]|nr:serine/threonine protein kinase [Deltaproteobacteria bacterium]
MDEALRGLVIDGKYRLTRPLGEGGMGVVWVATHTALGREFAVKLLRPEFAGDPQALIRFQQEAVAVSKVGSPHLVALTDFGTTTDGAPYIVMELLEGRTLEEAMREEKPMPVSRIVDIAGQILTALAAVHERGIVHRDLKPANVFLTQLGERRDFVKLLDFGVAKVLGGDRVSHFTRTGVLLGTPTYMSPEQVQGSRGVDHRCDLWAVGVILFRALTGRRPHDAASRGERLAAIATQDVPPLRRFRPDLDEDLEAVLRRALTRELGRRFATALDFRAALEPFRGQVPSAYATSIAPPPAAPLHLRLAAAFSGPAAAGRPTAPAVGPAAPAASVPPTPQERPTVGPALGDATRQGGTPAAVEPKEFPLEATMASGPPTPASFPSAEASAPPGPSYPGGPAEHSLSAGAVEPSWSTGAGEPSLTRAAGLRRRPGAAVAITIAVGVVLVVTLAVWLLARPSGGGSSVAATQAGGDADGSPERAAAVATPGDAGVASDATGDAGVGPEPLDPGLRDRYVRVQTQVTCWQYYRMYDHPKSPAWSPGLDVPEACLRERLSLRDWRRVLETLTPEELLKAASESTLAAVPCIAEASGLPAGQVQNAVPTIAGQQAGAFALPPPPPPRRNRGPAATTPPPPPPPPPPMLDTSTATTSVAVGTPDGGEPADAGPSFAAGEPDVVSSVATGEPDGGPPAERGAEADVAGPAVPPGGLPGAPDAGGTKDVHETTARQLRPVPAAAADL